MSQEPIFAAWLLSPSPSNSADSLCQSRSYLHCFPQLRRGGGISCSCSKARVQQAEERWKQNLRAPAQQAASWGGSPHQQSRGGRWKSLLPCGSGCCWLLPVGRVGRLGAVSGRSCVGSLGGGNRSGAGIVGGRAVPLHGLAIGRGGGRGRVTYNRGQPAQIRDLSDCFTPTRCVPDLTNLRRSTRSTLSPPSERALPWETPTSPSSAPSWQLFGETEAPSGTRLTQEVFLSHLGSIVLNQQS